MGLTQEQLAEQIGLSRTSVTNIERGRQHVVLHQIYEIAAALGLNVEALLPKVPSGEVSSHVTEKLRGHVSGDKEPEVFEWAAMVAMSTDAKKGEQT